MYVKQCPYCSRCSYSAARHSRWECPYCGKDITWVEARVPQIGEEEREAKKEGKKQELERKPDLRPKAKGKVLMLRSRC